MIAVPIVIVWILGFPVFVFYILNKNKVRLGEHDFLIKYGLYYVGLKDDAYFWEIAVINARKVVFILIFVSLA